MRNCPDLRAFSAGAVAATLSFQLSFTSSLRDAVAESDAIFIAVGTPALENGEADLSYVEQAAEGNRRFNQRL